MNYKSSLLLIMLLCSSFSVGKHYTQGNFDKMKRLLGTWKMYNDNGVQYERWRQVDNGEIAVQSYKLNNKDTVVLEDVKVKLDSGHIYYIPTVYGQNNNQPIKFAMSSCSRRSFSFENAGHDFPQKITYELLEKDSLDASIEGMWRGKFRKAQFHYVRMQ